MKKKEEFKKRRCRETRSAKQKQKNLEKEK